MTSLDISNNDIGLQAVEEGWRSRDNDGLPPFVHTDGRELREDPQGSPSMEGVIAICKAISTMASLAKIDISNSNLRPEGAKVLAEKLKENSTLQELNIAGNLLSFKSDAEAWDDFYTDLSGILAISKVIPTLRALVAFDISNNDIRAEGGQALAKALMNNNIMTSLNISDNFMACKETGEALADMLKVNTVLKELDISRKYDRYDDKAYSNSSFADELAAGIRANGTLEKLTISGDEWGWEEGSKNSKPFTIETSMTEADFNSKFIGTSGAIMLASFLPKCK